MTDIKSNKGFIFFLKLVAVLCTIDCVFARRRTFTSPLSTTQVPFIYPYQTTTSSSSSTIKLTGVNDWSLTEINVKKLRYSWTILNYSFNGKKTGEFLESSTFDINEEYKCFLTLWPQSRFNSQTDFVSLYLTLLSENDLPLTVPITYKFGLVEIDNRIYYPKNANVVSYDFNNEEGYNEFMTKDFLHDYLHDDKLTIIADIAIRTGLTTSSRNCSQDKSENYDHTANYQSLWENELYSDVILKVDQFEFKAHKNILASISPVFFSEFENIETFDSSILEINDVEPILLKELLRFIYTGKVEKIEEIAKDLLPLANKFQIEQLKSICEEALCRNLNLDNAVDIFNVATDANATYLKEKTLNYVAVNAESVIDSPNFASFISQPQNSMSVIRALINN